MKLINIYIENFGCLHQYELKLEESLTVIREDNGFGKTTLAEFIRAMFYGFPRAAKTLDKNRRKKYLPWSGGKCGGHLTFELEGVQYRIERTFGATPKGDTFNLIDLTTNRRSSRFSEEIGVELFGLDSDSFERSTYMPQAAQTGPLSTDSIRAKLGDLVEDSNDVGNFDKAVTALRSRRSSFIPYRGSGGSVAEARGEISRLQQELEQTERKQMLLDDVRAEAAQLEGQLEEDNRKLARVREDITAGAQAAADAAVRKYYEELLTRYRDAQAAAETRFVGGIPGTADFEEAERDCGEYLAVTAQLGSAGLSAAEGERLAELEQFFDAGVPDEDKLEALNGQHRQLLQMRTMEESSRLPDEQMRELEEMRSFFAPCGLLATPADAKAEAAAARKKLDKATQLRSESQHLHGLAEDTDRKRKSARGAYLVIALAVALLGIGAVLCVTVENSMVIGGVLLGIGFPALIAGIVQVWKSRSAAPLSGAQQELLRQLWAMEAEASRLEREAGDFVHLFLKNDDLAAGLEEIAKKAELYDMLTARSDAAEKKRIEISEVVRLHETELRAELRLWFGEVRDFEQAILALRMKRSSLMDLRAKRAASEEFVSGLQAQAAQLDEKLRAFLSSYYDDIVPERFRGLLTRLQRECDDHIRAKEQLMSLEEQVNTFRAEHAEVLRAPAEEPVDLVLLKQQERELAGKITNQTRRQLELKQRIRELQAQISRIPELQSELEHWQEKKLSDQQKSDTLDRTLEYLQQARENLSGNYLGTIQRSFGQLLGRMTGEDREKILLTGDLEVQLERQGHVRELTYFSAGQTDAVMLCMRFALVDAMFRDVKPFVILDDPFVNLDDTHTREALALVKELAEDRQIIYLTCNSSRV